MQQRADVHAYLTRDQLRSLRERSTWWGVGLIAHCWAVIAGAMALVAWAPNLLTVLLAVAVIGSRQLGLAVLMHEGAHGGLARSGRFNLRLSQWLCAYPVLAETLAYRDYHLTHHRHTQGPGDPDLVLSAPFPTSRASLRRKVIRDLTGRTGLKQRRTQLAAAWGPPGLPPRERAARFGRALGPQLGVNAALFAGLAALGHWWLYPLLWVLPLLTWQQLVTRVRNIAEHAVLPAGDPWRIARTTRAGPLARAFFAPYFVNYHAEHHLLVHIPCYRLRRLHRLLMAGEVGPRLEVGPGYAAVLRAAAGKVAA
ncbi:MAG: Fatty acid desaturase [uncultured Sphingomonadaceae bacterium]|uniref:Fatty acid desaturase n=1 Tax=uncultured Sphingomonadaceae bacterium TaxID=169976 RepID=A0A6J4SJ87_9SPHN|nr:MAG: Fatty acid desaturase [uncultured Sphingomonadaceae bacterium]